MASPYRLVFDIAHNSMRVGLPTLVPLILTGFGAFLVFKPALMERLMPGGFQGKARKVFSWFYFLFAASMTLVFLFSTFGERHRLQTARSSGAFSVTEGCLQSFHPMPATGHDTERLGINGRCLAYSDFLITPAFNRTEAYGGPIHADSRLRVSYAGGSIIRLEVVDHACPPAPDLGRDQAC